MSKDYTPWFDGDTYKPYSNGPYECRNKETNATGMRWWNGENWSKLLDHDPDMDDKLEQPLPVEFPTYDTLEQELAFYGTFQWRGFNTDQEPL
jgi:hypothetical protein